MRNQLLLYFLFFCALSYAQEKKKLITGKVLLNEEVVSDVHIINKNSNHGTSSNDFGLFEISVVLGDTLVLSHINFNDTEIAITEKIIKQELLKVYLEGKTYELEEITLEKPKSIFYIDPEIMPPPKVNAKTLNLPYANTNAKKIIAS